MSNTKLVRRTKSMIAMASCLAFVVFSLADFGKTVLAKQATGATVGSPPVNQNRAPIRAEQTRTTLETQVSEGQVGHGNANGTAHI